MQTQDRQLLRRFLQIQAGIHLLTLHPRSRSTRCHTYSHHAPADDVSDDVIAQNRDRVDLYAADYVDDVTMTYETWPRRPRQRARMQSEPEHLVRTEYDSVTSCLPRFGLHPEEYEADEDEDEEAEEEDADTPTNSDAEPVFSPQHKHYFPCSPPPDFAPPKPPRTYASGGGGGGGVAMAAGNPVSRVDRQGAYVDIYDISDEDVRKRSRLWREAEREKQTTGSVDKKIVAALSVIM
ncbi:PREDICTED: uncharacterized protein LOC106814589 [Priapulus caudatus]|uniref:Uncharacterized protein LOC106814589 n=1 Tax=Priapulus caudatus TaxID=37621 RepID=A0ABM1EQE6_PRICU|nr:PREDICTED: uncharacterized protein LOC106814589 [Priapulus caudatus]